jgi:hypothetical protein
VKFKAGKGGSEKGSINSSFRERPIEKKTNRQRENEEGEMDVKLLKGRRRMDG